MPFSSISIHLHLDYWNYSHTIGWIQVYNERQRWKRRGSGLVKFTWIPNVVCGIFHFVMVLTFFDRLKEFRIRNYSFFNG